MGIEVDVPRVTLRACGYTFTVRRPTLAELSAMRAGDGVKSMKKLLACIVEPDADELARIKLAKPALHIALWQSILSAFGYDSAALVILDEDEITDEAMAAAYVLHKSSNNVHALAYERRAIKHALLLRDLRGPEVDALVTMPLPSVDKVRDTIARATLWGDAKAIEYDAPGLYLTIADYLLHQAGMGAEVEEGEFCG